MVKAEVEMRERSMPVQPGNPASTRNLCKKKKKKKKMPRDVAKAYLAELYALRSTLSPRSLTSRIQVAITTPAMPSYLVR